MRPQHQIAQHNTHWKNMPSPVSNLFTGMKLEPKPIMAMKTHMKPVEAGTMLIINGQWWDIAAGAGGSGYWTRGIEGNTGCAHHGWTFTLNKIGGMVFLFLPGKRHWTHTFLSWKYETRKRKTTTFSPFQHYRSYTLFSYSVVKCHCENWEIFATQTTSTN